MLHIDDSYINILENKKKNCFIFIRLYVFARFVHARFPMQEIMLYRHVVLLLIETYVRSRLCKSVSHKSDYCAKLQHIVSSYRSQVSDNEQMARSSRTKHIYSIYRVGP